MVQFYQMLFHEGATVAGPHSPFINLGFTPERASVLGVLAGFYFLHYFLEVGTIESIFTDGFDL